MSEEREAYKMTELGEIPKEWEVLSTEEIVVPEKNSIKIGPFGSQLKKEYLVSEGYKVYGQENVFVNDFTLGNRFIDGEKFNQLKSCELLPNDFVITMMGTIGKCAVVPPTVEKGIMDSHLLRLRLNESLYTNDLLLHVIKSEVVQKQIKKLSVGGIMAGLSSKVIRQLKLPVPSIQEQQKIASILSTVDEQIDETEQLIVRTKELKKGLMQQLLAKGIGHTEFKQTELGAIPATWEIKIFEDIMQPKGEGIRRGPFGGALKKEIFVECGYAVYEQQHVIHNLRDTFRYYITEEKFTELKSFEVLPGDVLISCSGTVGKVLIVPEESPLGVINQALLRLRPNLKTDIHFLYYLLTSDFVQKRMLDMTHGSALKNMVSIGELKSILLAIPNTLEEQQKIASILSTVDEQIEVYEQEKAEYEDLKKGLMQQLLTGQIRVKI